MISYYLYLLYQGRFIARQEFCAAHDEKAKAVADLVLDACSDQCEASELWNGSRLVHSRDRETAPPAIIGFHETGEALIEAEQLAVSIAETLLRTSAWIAHSRRLEMRLAEMRDGRNSSRVQGCDNLKSIAKQRR